VNNIKMLCLLSLMLEKMDIVSFINSIISNNAFGFFRPCKALLQRQYSFSIVIYILGFELFSRLPMGEHQRAGMLPRLKVNRGQVAK